LGADTFVDLTDGRWRESRRVLDLLEGRILVFVRPSSRSASTTQRQEDDSTSPDENDNDSGNLPDLEDRIGRVPNARLLRVDHLEDVSSSQVRSCDDVSQLERMVVPDVLDYIREHELYAFAPS